ncbi:hypothetical protein E2C01_030575 [Portunus trituberculatus]|uniref:Uncharacterized protein n=1 Tax=Portunus trituberculatus TaxID=210409 RepID=A0A5B7ER68_PORTR|nr:hypothetical protein [Portunus trituberculatus]
MKAVLFALLVCASVCVVAGVPDFYDRHALTQFSLCGFKKKSGSIYVQPRRAAILTFGNPPGSKQPPPGRDIHECLISINTRENFSLSAVIEEMSIAATLNENTRGWECDGDYLKISTSGTSFISKILNIIPGDFFRSKKTDKLCGVRKGKPRDAHLHCNDTVSYTCLTLSYKLKLIFERQEIVLLRSGAESGFVRHG